MTVKELIAFLQTCDPIAVVAVDDQAHGCFPLDSEIETDHSGNQDIIVFSCKRSEW